MNDSAYAKNEFLRWVEGLLPKDKYAYFVSLLTSPIKTNELCEQIFDQLEKVYDARDSFYDYVFDSDEEKKDWLSYVAEESFMSKWRIKSFNALKTSINSIIIVDVPEEQEGEKPEPYYYFLDISQVIDYESEENEINWIIFNTCNNKIAIFDEEFYRTFEKDDKGNIKWNSLIEREHNLDECPARFFWSTPLSSSVSDLKMSPLSNQLSNLDWALMFMTSKKHLDLYAPYPIYWGFKQNCDYSNLDTGDYCDGGVLKTSKGDYKVTGSSIERCPICTSRSLVGAGTIVEVPPPGKDGMGNETADMRNPVGLTGADTASLKYNVEESERLKEEIFYSVVGKYFETKEAVNEKQVASNYESRQTVLMNIKQNIELSLKWTVEIICKLRYTTFSNASINMGSEFFLYTSGELRAQYIQAKEAGANDSELDGIQTLLNEVEYKKNPYLLKRINLISKLEPFKHLSTDQTITLFDKGVVTKEELLLKTNLSNIISQFEAENMDITLFGNNLSEEKKLLALKEGLKKYVTEPKEIDASSSQDIQIEAARGIIMAAFPDTSEDIIDSILNSLKKVKTEAPPLKGAIL